MSIDNSTACSTSGWLQHHLLSLWLFVTSKCCLALHQVLWLVFFSGLHAALGCLSGLIGQLFQGCTRVKSASMVMHVLHTTSPVVCCCCALLCVVAVHCYKRESTKRKSRLVSGCQVWFGSVVSVQEGSLPHRERGAWLHHWFVYCSWCSQPTHMTVSPCTGYGWAIAYNLCAAPGCPD